jgi:hypothetical protein
LTRCGDPPQFWNRVDWAINDRIDTNRARAVAYGGGPVSVSYHAVSKRRRECRVKIPPSGRGRTISKRGRESPRDRQASCQKLIDNGRNKIVVLNQAGIKKLAGSSYGVPEKEYRRLIAITRTSRAGDRPAKLVARDEAFLIAVNIAKLPSVPRQILKDISGPPNTASRDD